jgi:hypothetical protein
LCLIEDIFYLIKNQILRSIVLRYDIQYLVLRKNAATHQLHLPQYEIKSDAVKWRKAGAGAHRHAAGATAPKTHAKPPGRAGTTMEA